MTNILILIVGLLVLIAFIVVIVLLLKQQKTGKGNENDAGLRLILTQVNELARMVDGKVSDLNRTVDMKLGESTRFVSDSLHKQFGESQRLIKDITKELTEVKETGKSMVSFADELQNLQEILKNPKQRGIVGEYYLETLLRNVLPPGTFQMQYPFKGDNVIVDAAVFVKEKIIPVDSKFSLENYNRLVVMKDPVEKERLEKEFVNDLKKRIQETAKYIRPEEGTMDFAFMFIPHEAIYYDLLINKVGAVTEETENLIERAARHYKVIIVSPTSFLAYLQTVLQGLKAMQIEEKAQDIVKRVGELGKHLKSYEEYHGKLGNALGTVVNHFNASNKEFRKIDKDVLRITESAVGVEALQLDKPEQEV